MMNKVLFKSTLLLVFSLFFLTSANAHKFYMSITDMEYNPKTKSLQVIVKFFIDDLEVVLEKENDTRILLGTEREAPETDQYIKSYISSHFIVEQSKGSLSPKYVGKETDKDYTWVYIEFEKFKPKDASSISNTLLLKYFPEQVNKVNYKNGDIKKSFTLHKNKIVQEF